MEKEYEAYDYDGNLFYLIIEQGQYKKELINCYAYRKKKILKIFNTKEFIENPDSILFDKRCNSYILSSEINTDNKDEKINYLLENVTNQVNEVIIRNNKYKKGLELIFSTENKS
jgi:hypothetical protein